MQFRIEYVHPTKPSRIVGPEHFERSRAFHPVLQLRIGQSLSNRYRSAGYDRITRVR
jgi:hypothetical protein